jgi:glycosyltransferase involved in cell wall biosynthesis
MLVTVVINCLDGERYLREALDSVFAQTYPDWEIVFWDNHSSDATGRIASSYGDRVRYFRSDETHPLGQARNLALHEAKGDLIAFLDADDIWLPRKLEKQVPLFERNADVGLVFCDTIFFNDRGDIGPVYRARKPPRGRVFRQLLSDYFLSMETAVVRRRALDGLGEWFDGRLRVAEEKDLFLRLAHGWELDYVDEPLAKWRVHPESHTYRNFDRFGVENAMILDKLRRLEAGFDDLYAAEVESFQRKIAWQCALSEWRAGRASRCRELLRPYLLTAPKFAAAYALSALGPRAFDRMSALYYAWRRY